VGNLADYMTPPHFFVAADRAVTGPTPDPGRAGALGAGAAPAARSRRVLRRGELSALFAQAAAGQ
jgi:hypothetical protein